MKHSVKITIIMLIIFLLAQFIGLGILYKYIDQASSTEEETVFKELPIGERPPVSEKTSYIPIILALLIGTVFFLFLVKHQWTWLLKAWFLLAVVFSLTISFGAFFTPLIAFFISLVLGLWKLFKPNVLIQNFTELFVYGGLAVIFAPIFNVFSGVILLILISIYDAYAVWKSKHMITLAKSQTKAKIFAGLMIPYQLGIPKKAKEKQIKKSQKETKSNKVMVKVRTAILGGGDIGFPLIFAGIILKDMGLWQSLIIPPFAALGLAGLLWKSEEKKFYPAMPFISAGCLVGLGIVWLLGLI